MRTLLRWQHTDSRWIDQPFQAKRHCKLSTNATRPSWKFARKKSQDHYLGWSQTESPRTGEIKLRRIRKFTKTNQTFFAAIPLRTVWFKKPFWCCSEPSFNYPNASDWIARWIIGGYLQMQISIPSWRGQYQTDSHFSKDCSPSRLESRWRPSPWIAFRLLLISFLFWTCMSQDQ